MLKLKNPKANYKIQIQKWIGVVYTHKDREWLCICVQFADPIYEIQIRLLWCEEGPANAQWERERESETVEKIWKFEGGNGEGAELYMWFKGRASCGKSTVENGG